MAEIGRLARETGFVKRESKKVDALKFVKMLLFDQLRYDQPSLQQHAFELLADKDVNISKQAVHKRFKTTAVEFISKLFESYLAHSINCDSIASSNAL